MTAADLDDLLHRAETLPYGRARVAALEGLIQKADAEAPDSDVPFRARFQLIYSYIRSGERVRSFVPFAWCLAQYDADRERFGEFTENLLWAFKWQIEGLTLYPEVPLDRTLAVLDDMERRYREGGHGLNAIHGARHTVAWHLGDLDAAAEHYRRWDAAPVDPLSDCRGCLPSSKADYLTAVGRHEDAVRLAEPVLAGTLSCSEQPFGILTNLLEPYAVTGRHEAAADAHRKAYRMIRSDRSQIPRISTHLQFLARTGNPTRALELVESHVNWLGDADSPWSAMKLSAAIGRALADVDPSLPVRRAGTTVAAGELRAECTALSREIAGRFDARNGTTSISERNEEDLAGIVWADDLPLTMAARRTRQAAAGPASAVAAPEVVPTVLPPQDSSAADLMEHFEQRWVLRDDAGSWAALAALDALDPAAWSAGLRGRHLAARGLAAANRDDDLPAAIRAWQEALDPLAEAGDDLTLRRTRARLGSALAELGDEAEGRAVALEPLRWLATNDTPDSRRAGWAMRLAMLVMEDDPAEAEQVVAAARALDLGVKDAAAAASLHAHALLRLDRVDEALQAHDAAVAAANASGIPELRINAHGSRGQLLLRNGAPERARDDLAEAVALLAALGHDAPHALIDLGWAELAVGNASAAAEAGEEALRALSPDDAASRAGAHRVLIDAYRRLGEPAVALEELRKLREVLPPPGASDQATWDQACLNEDEGQILVQLEREAEAVHAFDVAAEAMLGLGATDAAVGLLRRAGSSAVWSGQDDAAHDRRERASSLLGDLEPSAAGFHRAGLLFDRAEQEMRDENGAAAAHWLLQAATAYRQAEQVGNADDCVMRAAHLHPDAVSVADLDAVHDRQQPATQPWFRSGYLLVDALTAAGKQRTARTLQKVLDDAQASETRSA